MSSGTGLSSGGSSASGVTSGSTFSELRLTVQTVADALTDPADSPTDDTARLVTDGTNVALYVWDSSASTWSGVQLG